MYSSRNFFLFVSYCCLYFFLDYISHFLSFFSFVIYFCSTLSFITFCFLYSSCCFSCLLDFPKILYNRFHLSYCYFSLLFSFALLLFVYFHTSYSRSSSIFFSLVFSLYFYFTLTSLLFTPVDKFHDHPFFIAYLLNHCFKFSGSLSSPILPFLFLIIASVNYLFISPFYFSYLSFYFFLCYIYFSIFCFCV